MKRFLYLSILLSFIAIPNAFVDKENWNGQSEYAEGYSKWSTSVCPVNDNTCIRQWIYLPVDKWSGKKTSTSKVTAVTTVTDNGSVIRTEGKQDFYRPSVIQKEEGCSEITNRSKGLNSSIKKTNCGKCIPNSSGNSVMCTNPKDPKHDYICFKDNSKTCYNFSHIEADRDYTQRCVEAMCSVPTSTSKEVCSTQGETKINTGCKYVKTEYYYKASNVFKDVNEKSNWKQSLNDAGGYAKKVAVYNLD